MTELIEAYISEKELARRWGFSHKTLQQWRWHGLGPAYLRIGGRIRYTSEQIRDFEQQHLSSPAKHEPNFLQQSSSII